MLRLRKYSINGIITLVCSLGLFVNSNSAYARINLLTLILGQQKTVDAPNMKRVSVGNPAIADVTPLSESKQILITAMGVGETDIIIWDSNDKQRVIKVRIVTEDIKKVGRSVRELLKNVEGIHVSVGESKILIKGKAYREEDLKIISKIEKMFPYVINFTSLSPTVLDTITKHINLKFDKYGLHNVQAEKLGNVILLTGEVPNEQAKEKVEMIATVFDVDIQNFVKIGVSLEKMVLLNVDFVEVDKGGMLEAGVKWGDSIGIEAESKLEGSFGTDLDPGYVNEYKVNGKYSATINMLQKNEWARILSRPKLLCRSGENAEFISGGEFPLAVVTLSTTNIEYKQYGMILNMKPVVDSEDNIAISILVENSTVADFVDGHPAFHTSRVKTFVNVKKGETIVLSGLVNEADAKSVDKIPFLGSIPILGELFKSRAFREDRSELLIFVTPEVVTHDSAKSRDLINKMDDSYQNADRNLKYQIMD